MAVRDRYCAKGRVWVSTIDYWPYDEETCVLLSECLPFGDSHCRLLPLLDNLLLQRLLGRLLHIVLPVVSFPRSQVAHNRGSLGLIIRLTAANFRVCFAFPFLSAVVSVVLTIAAECVTGKMFINISVRSFNFKISEWQIDSAPRGSMFVKLPPLLHFSIPRSSPDLYFLHPPCRL